MTGCSRTDGFGGARYVGQRLKRYWFRDGIQIKVRLRLRWRKMAGRHRGWTSVGADGKMCCRASMADKLGETDTTVK